MSAWEFGGIATLLIFALYFSMLFHIMEYRARKYMELSALADDRWLCKKLAEALEIDADGEDAGSYVADAIRMFTAKGERDGCE